MPINFNNTSPSAPTGYVNVTWQVDESGEPILVSGYVPQGGGGTGPTGPAGPTGYTGPGGSLSPGFAILENGVPYSGTSSWVGYSTWCRVPGSSLSFLPTSWTFSLAFVGGTGVHIAKALLFTAPLFSTNGAAITQVATFTFIGNTSEAIPFGRTASVSSPYVVTSDALTYTLANNVDYYIAVYFDSDGVYNSSIILGNFTDGNTTGFYASGDPTGATTVPGTPGISTNYGLSCLTCVTGSGAPASQVITAGSAPTSTGTAGIAGQIVYYGGFLYFCSVTGAAGAATWNQISMTAV